nr:hypothetical protein [Desulfobulbaceae bacterium]
MARVSFWLIRFMIILLALSGGDSEASVVDTKHNLSSSGPGEIRAILEDQVCIFCHTPHNAAPKTPLWNRAIDEGVNYVIYDSTTFNAKISQPSGPSRLCLSCHDGTVGLGALLSRPEGVTMTMGLMGRPSMLGTDLSNDHPFSFSYSEALPFNVELHGTLPSELLFYNTDVVHCSTCHNPHDDTYGMFLSVSNKNAALCILCHNVSGWQSSSHATSGKTWSRAGNNPWPLNARLTASQQRNTVAENGCENCHTPHNAGGPQRLLNFLEEEKNCTFACHNGNVSDPGKNISSQLIRSSAHPVDMATIGSAGTPHDPTEDVTFLHNHVECQDCHDPHSTYDNPAVAPFVSGSLTNVKGIDQAGSEQYPAAYEYEICFKCHSHTNTVVSYVNRYLDENDTRREFATTNPSYHPVIGAGVNLDVPSLPSVTSPDQSMDEYSLIYCSDCHSGDDTAKIGGNGANGPHGSIYAPILRERYERADGTSESYQSYALCYRCHDRTNLLADQSFKRRTLGTTSSKGGHSGHTAVNGVSCSVCHDPHGVVDNSASGDHTHLINFDSTVVSPASGEIYPLFDDTGNFTGSCALICHGVTHGSASHSYP